MKHQLSTQKIYWSKLVLLWGGHWNAWPELPSRLYYCMKINRRHLHYKETQEDIQTVLLPVTLFYHVWRGKGAERMAEEKKLWSLAPAFSHGLRERINLNCAKSLRTQVLTCKKGHRLQMPKLAWKPHTWGTSLQQFRWAPPVCWWFLSCISAWAKWYTHRGIFPELSELPSFFVQILENFLKHNQEQLILCNLSEAPRTPISSSLWFAPEKAPISLDVCYDPW